MNSMEWIDQQEKAIQEDKSKDYFNFKEGDNRIVLLTHCAPFAQKWTGSTYVPAEMNDEGISVKGVCWVLQDGVVKHAKLPYTIVKQIRELMKDEDYAFEEFPMNRGLNLKAVNAGTKEVEYSVIPSPKEYIVPQAVLDELAKKPSPEEMIEKIKAKHTPLTKTPESYEEEKKSYNAAELINEESPEIPF